ncbi:MAG: LysR family transcriptional regulator [Rhodanobacteraceae bacterium]|nr:MAG: LysR family transcriptional regulator [Rhodanobacteraceae bacterium]
MAIIESVKRTPNHLIANTLRCPVATKHNPKSALNGRPARPDPESTARFYYKGSRFKQLQAFVAIAQLGTLTRAAESLFLSAPSVSLRLQALERELGAQLLQRGRRHVTLTRAGQTLLEYARPLIEGLDTLDAKFHSALPGIAEGELTIAAGTSTIQYLLPPLVTAYRKRYPSVRLQLANVTGKDGLAMLRSDHADFAVGSMLDVPNDLLYQPFRRYDPMLILPRGHPLAEQPNVRLEDLSPYGLILPPQRLTTYRMVDMVFKQHRVPYTVAIEVGGWEVIKQYVGMGLGISIVTSICLTDADQGNLVSRNMNGWFPQRSYGVVMVKGKYLPAEARNFINLIRPGLLHHREHDEIGDSER